jgi:hypothetical protein
LHAGNREEGLIDRCDLFFLAKAKDGDYHQEMNGPTFLNWFENQLMPAIKSPIVTVLDNASYHNIKTDETVVPNFNWGSIRNGEQGFLGLRDFVGWQFYQF